MAIVVVHVVFGVSLACILRFGSVRAVARVVVVVVMWKMLLLFVCDSRKIQN